MLPKRVWDEKTKLDQYWSPEKSVVSEYDMTSKLHNRRYMRF